MILAGGGSKSPLWRQIFADVFNMPVVTLDGAGEGSGFGAAIVAGVGCGLFGSVAEISERLNIKSVTEPIGENVSVYDDVYEKYCGLYARLKGI